MDETGGRSVTLARLTIVIGILLVVLGVGAYLITGRASMTSLIPAFLGLPLAGLGYGALYPGQRQRAMHIAAALVAIGVLGTIRGTFALIAALAGEGVQIRFVVQAITFVLCAVLLGAYIYSFVSARRRPE